MLVYSSAAAADDSAEIVSEIAAAADDSAAAVIDAPERVGEIERINEIEIASEVAGVGEIAGGAERRSLTRRLARLNAALAPHGATVFAWQAVSLTGQQLHAERDCTARTYECLLPFECLFGI